MYEHRFFTFVLFGALYIIFDNEYNTYYMFSFYYYLIFIGSRWTRAEDAALHYAVLPYIKNNDPTTSDAITPNQWETIAKHVPGKNRNGEQCKSRWYGVLSQGLIKGPWTEQEDAEVVQAITSVSIDLYNEKYIR